MTSTSDHFIRSEHERAQRRQVGLLRAAGLSAPLRGARGQADVDDGGARTHSVPRRAPSFGATLADEARNVVARRAW
jgi:hypothetical protein